jgi:hypothetical protein
LGEQEKQQQRRRKIDWEKIARLCKEQSAKNLEDAISRGKKDRKEAVRCMCSLPLPIGKCKPKKKKEQKSKKEKLPYLCNLSNGEENLSKGKQIKLRSTGLGSGRSKCAEGKTVGFDGDNTIYHLENLTEEEALAIWFTCDEDEEMLHEAQSSAVAVEQGVSDVEARGLESQTVEGKWITYKAKKNAYDAVLGEIEDQQRRGRTFDCERVSRLYQQVVAESLALATSRAKTDESEAKLYLSLSETGRNDNRSKDKKEKKKKVPRPASPKKRPGSSKEKETTSSSSSQEKPSPLKKKKVPTTSFPEKKKKVPKMSPPETHCSRTKSSRCRAGDDEQSYRSPKKSATAKVISSSAPKSPIKAAGQYLRISLRSLLSKRTSC